MPLFSHKEPEPPPPPPVEEPHSRRSGLFGSKRREPSPTGTHYSTRTTNSVTGRHSGETSRTSISRASGTGGGGSLLSKFGRGSRDVEMDPSIVNARNRVMGAEDAERNADKALETARREVQLARAEVKRLEAEAAEEARLAKIKQHHAAEVSKRGSALGRHGG